MSSFRKFYSGVHGRLGEITGGHRRLHVVTGGHRRLREVILPNLTNLTLNTKNDIRLISKRVEGASKTIC